MGDNILVYGSTTYKAHEKLQELLDDMRYGDVNKVIKSKNNFRIELKNGDSYKALLASENARGYMWQYAYVDTSIDDWLLNNVVLPKFVPRTKDGVIDRSTEIEERLSWY